MVFPSKDPAHITSFRRAPSVYHDSSHPSKGVLCDIIFEKNTFGHRESSLGSQILQIVVFGESVFEIHSAEHRGTVE